MKFLILALSGIGDAIMFTPALRLLREKYPDSQIDALVMIKGVKDLYEDNNDLNNVIYYNFLEEGAFNSLSFILSQRKKYDITVNVYPSNRKEYNIINFLLGARKRAAVKYLRANKQNFGWLNNVTVTENDRLHNVQENIKLISKITGLDFKEDPKLQLNISKENKLFSELFLKEYAIKDHELVIGFHPGCATLKNHIKRRWEPEKFVELAIRLIKEKKARILIFGGPDEDDLKNFIFKSINSDRVVNVKTPDLMKSAAVMSRCDIFVTNDSSLMHISSALSLKVVAIIGPTNTSYIHPWKTDHKIVSLNLDCAPCFYYSPRPLSCSRTDVQYKCIKELTVDLVYKSVSDFISNSN